MHGTVDDYGESRPRDLPVRQTDATGGRAAHRQLVHHHAVVERVLPLGAPPFGHTARCADIADQAPADEAIPRETSWPADLPCRPGGDGVPPILRGGGRSVLARWLMNAHMLWLD